MSGTYASIAPIAFRAVVSVVLAVGLMPSFAVADLKLAYGEPASQNEEGSQFAEVGTVSGRVIGLDASHCSRASVVLYDASKSYTAQPASDGSYVICDIPVGTYYLKIEADGYSVPYPSTVQVNAGQMATTDLEVSKVDGSNFFYSWKADNSYFGYEESARPVEQPKFTFVDKDIYIADSAASITLASKHKVFLVDDDVAWSSDYASRLLDLFGDIALDWPGTPSKWVITNEHINNDIEVTYDDAQGDTVRVSIDAFQNSVPKLAQHNGVYGQYFSNRLFDVVVRYVTKNGTDTDKVDQILQKHFGCSITVPDYEALTAETTGETASAFEAFKPEELVAIIGMFQEMPEGFHKVPGLKYLVRRIDGSRNPIYPLAAAVSWVDNDPGYIEFIDDAFLGDVVNDTFRLILHEKTHFLWHDLFSDSTKQEWIRIGGWHEDSATESGWSTDKMTEFVSAYSHDINPDEDMAESVASYVLNPAKLQANAPEKYDFIKNCIMHGETYKAQIRDDLTFDVYNLYPDYAYPGRVVGMSVDVQGASDEDKTVTVTVDLDTHGNPAFGGEGGYMRIASTKVDQMYEASLEKTKEDGSQMRATFNVGKYSAADYWKCTSLSINDSAGNVRYLSDNNFGWKLYIDNALEDLEAPRFVEDSLKVDLVPEALTDGKVITHVTISFYATDNAELADCYCEIANNTHDTYRLDKWGTVDAQTGLCTVTYDFTGYYPSGEYSINYIKIHDKAKNGGGFNFYPDGSGTKSYTTFWFEGESSDLVGPELDVNNISISATPTNPDEPNGETVVKLGFWIKDNLSGLDYGSYNLLDPQGNIHMNYFYEPNHGWPFFDGDPTVWKYYESTIVLPVGSAPGLWGLQSMRLYDKAANFRVYNFEEIVHFKPATGDQLAAWGIVCDKNEVSVGQNYQLSIEGNNDDKEVVWECTNGTGRAIVDSRGELTPLSEGAVTVFAYAKDDTSVFGSIDIDILPEDPCVNGHEIVTDQAVAATCETAGLTEGSHCSRCGEVLVAQKEVPAIGHAPEVIAAVPATCTAAGLTEGSRCSNCGEVLAAQEKTEALGHDFTVGRVPPTCVEDGSVNYTCKRCGYHYSEVTSKTGHVWGAWSVTKEPTVSETGVMTRVCDKCGAEETKPINRLEPSTPEVENDLRHATLSLSNTRFEYDGFAKEPGVNVALNGKTLVQGIDYSIASYVDNVIPGQATVTVSGMGSYTGIASMNFEIVRSEGNELALPGSWVNDRNGWWYRNSDGSYPVSCWRIIEGVRYSFDSYGYMQVGWKAENSAWYYLDLSGAMATGWQQVGGAWYWFANDGVMATGWKNVESAWYLFASSGAMLTGWQQVGGTWYCLSGSGVMCTGWQQIGGSWYWLGDDGSMSTGWQAVNGVWYLLSGSGGMLTGWQQVGGVWYWLDGSGAMVIGWRQIGGSWYWFANSGAMAIGWFQAGGTYYYADGSGAMQRSRWIGDYYLTSSGAMATNQWIGSYYVDGNGKWVR